MTEDLPISITDLAEMVAPFVGSGVPLSPTPLKGGGSSRRFLRVRGSTASVVLMVVPVKPGAVPDRTSGHEPFVEIRDTLAEHGIRVPKIYAEARERGVLVVEDLGDDTLAQFVSGHPEMKETVYRTAIADLVRAQQALTALPEGSIINQRAFDEGLLLKEIQHFCDWALVARGIRLSSEQQRRFDRAAHFLATEITSWPRGFVHRDYQSRNLMVRASSEGLPELTWIDFQDALLGPRVYDLVALLMDSYQHLSRAFVRAKLDQYGKLMGLSPRERTRLDLEFDLVTVQRKLKDAGRFIYFDRVNSDPSFLQFVEPTMNIVMEALKRVGGIPQLADLLSLLTSVAAPGRPWG